MLHLLHLKYVHEPAPVFPAPLGNGWSRSSRFLLGRCLGLPSSLLWCSPVNTACGAHGNKQFIFTFSRQRPKWYLLVSEVFRKLQTQFKLKFVTVVLDDRECCMVFAISCKQHGTRDVTGRDVTVISELVKTHLNQSPSPSPLSPS